jgi:uncharacterized protein (DUF2461 family)
MDEHELAAIVELVEGEYLLGPSDARRLVTAVRQLRGELDFAERAAAHNLIDFQAVTAANAELRLEVARLAKERDQAQDETKRMRGAMLSPERVKMLVAMLKIVERKIDTWQAVCDAESKFGADSLTTEKAKRIDDAIMREIVTMTDGLEDEWKALFQMLLYGATVRAALGAA